MQVHMYMCMHCEILMHSHMHTYPPILPPSHPPTVTVFQCACSFLQSSPLSSMVLKLIEKPLVEVLVCKYVLCT